MTGGSPDDLETLFTTAAEACSQESEGPDWRVWEVLPQGSIIAIAAKVKTGKSTLVLDLICSVVTGEPWCGRPTSKCPVVYLTEQGRTSFNEQLAVAGLQDCQDLHVLYRPETSELGWAAVAQKAPPGALHHQGVAVNRPAKGRRAEHRSITLLEQQGYKCVRSAASKGCFDVVGVGPADVVLLQVKANAWPGTAEMESLRAFPCHRGAESWFTMARSLRRAGCQGTVKRLCVSKTKTNG